MREGRKASRRKYYLSWLIIALIPTVFAVVQIFVVIEAIARGYHREPAFWYGAIFFGLAGYYLHNIKNWFRNKPIILGLSFWALLISLYSLGRTGKFPVAIQFMMWGGLAGVMAGVRVFREEGFMGYGGKKVKKKKPRRVSTVLSVTKSGRDQRWIAGWIYRLRKPIQRTFIRGFTEDMTLLARVIHTLTDGKNLVFYCPFDPPNAQPDIFEETIRYAQKHQVSYKTFIEKHGRIKRLITGEDTSIGAISIDCSDHEILEWVLSNYWLGEYCCWLAAYKSDFQDWAVRMHLVLNPKTFPDGFKELVFASRCFMRDVEEGEALEVITDKLSREEIRESLSQLS